MNNVAIVVGLLSFIVGGVFAFLWVKGKAEATAQSALDRLTDAEKREQGLNTRLQEVLSLEGEMKSLREQLSHQNDEVANLRSKWEEENKLRNQAENSLNASLQLIAQREQALAEQKAQFKDDQKTLEDAFANLSKQALTQAQEQFLQVAEKNFKDARELSKEEIDKILSPMRDTLGKLETHTKEIEEKRTSSYSELLTQVKGLMGSTTSLSNALRRPEVRGSWGELTLRRVAEAAGLIEGKDYEMQVSETTDAGIQRPDMVVKLPNNRCIIIDAKVSFSAYQEAVESEDSEFKRQKLQEHSQQVKKHIEGLANKKYQSLYAGTADFVVMFVPNEALYQVALQEDPKLIDTAMDKRVVLANPMTLIALLRTVASGIEQQKAYESALQIAQLGGELHDSISTFAGHFTKVGNAITSAANAYNDGLGSLERNVTSKARKLKSMGIKSAKELNEVNPLNANVRQSALSSNLEEEIS